MDIEETINNAEGLSSLIPMKYVEEFGVGRRMAPVPLLLALLIAPVAAAGPTDAAASAASVEEIVMCVVASVDIPIPAHENQHAVPIGCLGPYPVCPPVFVEILFNPPGLNPRIYWGCIDAWEGYIIRTVKS